MSFVVLPEFLVAPARLDAFLEAAGADASHSCAFEEGCLQFDVIVERAPEGSQDSVRVMFYEVYVDRAAFDAHLETPHVAAFRDMLHLCDEQPVRFLDRRLP
ncbi:putative quinol monooxygenase [Celeribacter sp. ULVN23_4]